MCFGLSLFSLFFPVSVAFEPFEQLLLMSSFPLMCFTSHSCTPDCFPFWPQESQFCLLPVLCVSWTGSLLWSDHCVDFAMCLLAGQLGVRLYFRGKEWVFNRSYVSYLPNVALTLLLPSLYSLLHRLKSLIAAVTSVPLVHYPLLPSHLINKSCWLYRGLIMCNGHVGFLL